MICTGRDSKDTIFAHFFDIWLEIHSLKNGYQCYNLYNKCERMIELGRVKYDYSGKEDSYKEVIRQFTLDKLLERINLESADILMNGKDKDIPGVKRVKFKLYDAGSRIPRKQETFVSAWMLIELAYHAILWSNDYRGKKSNFKKNCMR